MQQNCLGRAELLYLGVPLPSIRMGTQISSANSALFLMAIVWDVLLLQDYILLHSCCFAGKAWERACWWQFGWPTHISRKRAAVSRFRTNCKVCSGSVPRSSWTGCWLQPVTPPWFITEVIVCVWFYTGDLWASRLPPHQLLRTSDAVTWSRRLAPCQKGTIKDVFKIFA